MYGQRQDSRKSEGPTEVKFRVPAGERAQAELIAESIGMNLNTVMKVCFQRFLRERGLPFDMVAPAPSDHGVDARRVSAFGLTVGDMAREAGAAFARARDRAAEDPPNERTDKRT